jgi:phospholipid/cholesterol/gamma-HCH transport system ATP-binding protein
MMPEELSGGMSKRVALARTLILKPEIILYDEPTTGLDPMTAREISTLIVDMQRKFHTSSIVISHDMHCVKLVSSRVALLDKGKCYWQGKYEEMEASGDQVLQEFFE